ncbi:hypothetical protein EH165_06530 [Nakamurella antarctica]|uniref:Uncharacterized protein n=1 Tax=Nakamurella antarctica TaxID=1902245 RepID=A0A3G8ZL15_9ACTN|nr:hypothetical protein [Nakamurella antarctica]AZI57858.1 hypothetical protein EH165_06530 [Nakamurella antarctica]
MTLPIDRRERVFQLWGYTVGMGRLCLRSTKSDQFTTRIDVVFQNVKAVHLPTFLQGLVISDANATETERIIRDTGMLPDNGCKFFSMVGSNFNGFVVASVITICEDDGEFFEPSRLWPNAPPLPTKAPGATG